MGTEVEASDGQVPSTTAHLFPLIPFSKLSPATSTPSLAAAGFL
jgi:hypothetical protein